MFVDVCKKINKFLLKALEEKDHKLNGRTIDPKRANPRREVCKKIFVGKCDPSTAESDLKEYFSKFGKVSRVVCNIYNVYTRLVKIEDSTCTSVGNHFFKQSPKWRVDKQVLAKML